MLNYTELCWIRAEHSAVFQHKTTYFSVLIPYLSSVFQNFDILYYLTQHSLLLKNCWFFSSYLAFSTSWISAYFLLVFVESWAKRVLIFQQLLNILPLLNTCLFSASFRWKLKKMGGRFLLIKSAEFTTLKSQYCWKLAGNLLIYWWLHAESCWMSADEMRRVRTEFL